MKVTPEDVINQFKDIAKNAGDISILEALAIIKEAREQSSSEEKPEEFAGFKKYMLMLEQSKKETK